MSSTAIGTFTCWDDYDGYELVEELPPPPPPPPPRRSRLPSTPALSPSLRKGAERSRERPHPSKATTGQAQREQDFTSLDELWSSLREKKHATEAKLPPKVKSLEAPGPSGLSRPTPEQHIATPRKPTPPKVKRKKSTDCVSFRESRSGRTITATFDLPGIKKEQAHVSFRWNNLVVTWQTVKITEKEEGGRLVREREEKKYTRTIPLPEGTKFEEIRAVMDNRHLILNYPNMRTVRVEPRPRVSKQAEPRRVEPTVISDGDIKSSDDFENASYLKSTDHSPLEEATEITDISEY